MNEWKFQFRNMYVELPSLPVAMESALMRAREEVNHDMESFAFGRHSWPCDVCDRREAGMGPLLGRWGDE